MRVDIGNALAPTADPGVTRSGLDDLDDRVQTAHDQIKQGITDDTFGYTALTQPESVDLDAIRSTVQSLGSVDTLFVIGIGGSALGATTLCHALGDETTVHILDNIDPASLSSLLEDVDFSSAAMHVVSRSGTTTETLANFLVVQEAFTDAGIDWTASTIVTTGREGPLRELADTHALPTLDSPTGVPGRFSVFSTVALPAAIIAGVDVSALIAGARAERETLTDSLYDCPSYAYGALCYALDQRGATINALLPYAEALEPFAEWVAQLWAESLGKDEGGQTPVRAMGVTDQHSQLQLYRAGPRDKVVTFVHPRDRPRLQLPSSTIPDLEYLEETTVGEVMEAERRATEASLAAVDRPSVAVSVPALDPEGLGQLLYGFQAATVLAGELYGVDTFTQPAVEWAKDATRELLSGRKATLDTGDSFVIE